MLEKEHQKWHKKNQADESPQKAMPPLPPKNTFKLFKGHALVDLLVFRDLSVGVEFGVTRERIRQLQNIALDKMRKALHRKESPIPDPLSGPLAEAS